MLAARSGGGAVTASNVAATPPGVAAPGIADGGEPTAFLAGNNASDAPGDIPLEGREGLLRATLEGGAMEGGGAGGFLGWKQVVQLPVGNNIGNTGGLMPPGVGSKKGPMSNDPALAAQDAAAANSASLVGANWQHQTVAGLVSWASVEVALASQAVAGKETAAVNGMQTAAAPHAAPNGACAGAGNSGSSGQGPNAFANASPVPATDAASVDAGDGGAGEGSPQGSTAGQPAPAEAQRLVMPGALPGGHGPPQPRQPPQPQMSAGVGRSQNSATPQ